MQKAKFKEFDIVNLRGTIVDVYNNGEAYEVEIVANNGETICLFTISEIDLKRFNVLLKEK